MVVDDFVCLIYYIFFIIQSLNPNLVGGFDPFEKYAHQIGSFPQIGMKIKNI